VSEKLQQILLAENEELKKEIARLIAEKEGINLTSSKQSYSFSSISEKKLKQLLNVKNIVEIGSKFDDWFNSKIEIRGEDALFLKQLLEKRHNKIRVYNEQTLSMKFISSILNRADFELSEKEISDFYEYQISYEFENFIFTGEPDFLVAKGVDEPEVPYFFIQEFKKTKDPKYPEPQLVAELITAIQINGWSEIKGAFIVGASWHFVVLEKVEERYQYYVSEPLLATRIDELQQIYKNLLFVKDEIIKFSKN
jgi:hypothetical protein